ncbi:MAG: DUF2127 domain-containing protein [Terracidiphilus sp.]|nr:DUF2127 domain-containing protein [Terracidiphilus sp.]
MTDSPAAETHLRQKHNKVLLLIALYKSALALLFAALGLGAFRLLGQDLGDVIGGIREALHFSPESRLIHFLAEKADLVDDALLRRIGALAFSYAAVSLIEGIGLYFEKAWAEILTLLITASFLPLELFEVWRHVTWLRVGLLVVNTLVLLYMVKALVERRKQTEMADTE